MKNSSSRLTLIIFSVFVLLLVGMNYFLGDGPASVIRYGFIDTKGRLIIPQEYDSVWDFHLGMAAVKKGKRTFMIDTSGKEVNKPLQKYTVDSLPLTPPEHASHEEYKSGKFAEQLLVWKREGYPALYRVLDTVIWNSKNPGHHKFYKYFFRKDSASAIRKYDIAFPYSENLALVRGGIEGKSNKNDFSFRFVDIDEKFVITKPYPEAHSFSGGLAAVGSGVANASKH